MEHSQSIKASFIYEYYKDQCSQMKALQTSRDKYFLFLLIVFSLFCSQFAGVQFSKDLISLFLNKKIPMSLSTQLSNILWIMLSLATIKHYHIHTVLGKKYKHIQHIEAKLKELNSNESILNQEGVYYFAEKRLFSDLYGFLTRRIIPISIIQIASIKVLIDADLSTPLTINTYTILISYFICVLFITSYLYDSKMKFKLTNFFSYTDIFYCIVTPAFIILKTAFKIYSSIPISFSFSLLFFIITIITILLGIFLIRRPPH